MKLVYKLILIIIITLIIFSIPQASFALGSSTDTSGSGTSSDDLIDTEGMNKYDLKIKEKIEDYCGPDKKFIIYFEDSAKTGNARKTVEKYYKQLANLTENQQDKLHDAFKDEKEEQEDDIMYWNWDEDPIKYPYKKDANMEVTVCGVYIQGNDDEDKVEKILDHYRMYKLESDGTLTATPITNANMDTMIVVFIDGYKVDENEERGNVEFKDVFDNVNEFVPSEDENEIEAIKGPAEIIFGLIRTIGIVASVLIIAILGIRYMCMSVEEKADFKETMIPYLIGAIVLFGVTSIAGILYDIGKSLNI